MLGSVFFYMIKSTLVTVTKFYTLAALALLHVMFMTDNNSDVMSCFCFIEVSSFYDHTVQSSGLIVIISKNDP